MEETFFVGKWSVFLMPFGTVTVSVHDRDGFLALVWERESGEMCVKSCKIHCCAIVAGVGVGGWVEILFLSFVKSPLRACIHSRGCH